MVLKGKKILIGISGSIAAYKMPLLVRLLMKEGAEVQIIMTPAARDFVTPLTLSTLSKRPVLTGPFNPVDGTWNSHVDMGNWADLMLVAPASATTLGKMANGIADNLLVTTYLAAVCPVFIAPAMDLDMFQHPSTRQNIKTLQSYGNHLIAPREGELASGLCGAGRLEEPEVILEILRDFFKGIQSWAGKKVLITAGPTVEPIDPVRYISNHSSGKMGYALAEEAIKRGADVTLVSGPVSLPAPSGVTLIKVHTAQQMLEACQKVFDASDLLIMAAAVADYRVAAVSDHKIKKQGGAGTPALDLVENPDIVKTLSAHRNDGQYIMGFALETDNELANAQSKLMSKGMDAIALNSLNEQGAGFGTDTNKVTLIHRSGISYTSGLEPKAGIAGRILDFIEETIVNP
ncbi:MAG TPA: bifunctional phosphopantothenoylcysteine decarboxylase/phosphopantothenate--cysteine ligase CoaBC [Bacteroidales bacterium]|nr:MAG: phosphopantothenoylcysteine decarboxylase [Bacteroidetes bacterium GWE2_42_24]OFY29804.1 MAG: phosphopantothenoylcysteine decarboxylase [Bacteroidetes bacterium GWF2_43_11]HBZ66392.1 bifunctional phosphopantothenoylcysteine decarboxylase/phosphopantothenate--cysteine ligase CoaBC [Bacteroidales bacterium]